MVNTTTLRDHSNPCEHRQAFQEHPNGPWECRRGVRAGRCPGGREVTREVTVQEWVDSGEATSIFHAEYLWDVMVEVTR